MVQVFDPLGDKPRAPTSRKRTARSPKAKAESLAAVRVPQEAPPPASAIERVKADFRLLLTLVWRHQHGNDPNRMQMDMAWWLQHSPDRSITMAFRGFSKSDITGCYALWRLLKDPDEQILVVSGSAKRAKATTTWCLSLIHTLPILQHLKPLPHQRQSTESFDVGPATPKQSPSFQAMGIGSQLVGFRGTCIVADDVETQTNSITVAMREKIEEAVKEFDSVILPGGVIRYLGTPHDLESLYNKLPEKGYSVRIWPGLYPTPERTKQYGGKLAPIIAADLRKNPGLVGRTIMPERFSDEDLASRKLSLGSSEFDLQFMLDTSASDRNKYPLRVSDLMVLSLDGRKGPEKVTWSADPQHRIPELQVLGFSGDFYHQAIVPLDVEYSPYSRVVGCVDNSGRGQDETALVIVAELHGTLFWLDLWAGLGGFSPETLQAIARRCVRFRVNKLRVESNFGDGMFAALLAPVLEAEWEKHNGALEKAQRGGLRRDESPGGTEIEEYKASNQMAKEKRLLSILEPVTQQHRLVVARKVLEWDYESLSRIDAQQTRQQYAWGYQFTHLTRSPDSLRHDDRLDALAGAVVDFADILGVDPSGMAVVAKTSRDDEELEKLFGALDDEDEYGMPIGRVSKRPVGTLPTSR